MGLFVICLSVVSVHFPWVRAQGLNMNLICV